MQKDYPRPNNEMSPAYNNLQALLCAFLQCQLPVYMLSAFNGVTNAQKSVRRNVLFSVAMADTDSDF